MGKAKILSGGTDGFYNVDLVRDISRITARLAQLTTRESEIASEIIFAEADVVSAQSALDAAHATYNGLIDDYEAGTATQDQVLAQADVVAEKVKAYKIVKEKRDLLILEQAALAKEREALEAVDEEIETDIWCADLTEDLVVDAVVGTAEIPGERQSVIIRPGYDGRADYSSGRDGILQPSQNSSAAMVAWNYAMMPGWQKWMPLYRYGTISSVDYIAGTCALTYDAETSSYQSINVNHQTTAADVPIEYMDCDAAVFEPGDEVLIEFQGVVKEQAGGNWDLPKVIGFKDNPRACPVFLESGYIEVPAGGAVGSVYYTDDLVAACCGVDAYLDWLHPDTLTGGTRAYSAGMASLSFPAGHSRQSFVTDDHAAIPGKLLKLWQCLTAKNSLATTIKGPNTTALSYALYTATGGDYYLLKITASAVSRAQLQYSDAGDDLLSDLQTDHGSRIDRFSGGHAAYRKREAYIFSEATGISAWTQIATITVEGEAIDRGWQVDWNGAECAIVTQEASLYTPSPDPGYDCVEYQIARRYKLAITESGGVPTGATLSTEETVNWTPSLGKDGIFTQTVTAGIVKNQQWFPYSCACDNGGYQYPSWLNAVAPVGCYYGWVSGAESLIVAKHFREALPTRSLQNLYDERNDQQKREVMYFCGEGDIDHEYRGWTGGTKSGFYLTAYAAAAKDELARQEGSGFYHYRHLYTSGSAETWKGCTYTLVVAPDFTCDPNEDVTNYAGCSGFRRRVENLLTYAYSQNNTSLFTESGENVLVFPAHSCEAIYLGTLHYFDMPSRHDVLQRQKTAHTQNQLNASEQQIATWRTRIPSLNIGPLTANYDGGWASLQTVSDTTADKDLYRVKWVLATREGAELLETIDAPGKGGGEGWGGLGNYRLLFNASPCGPGGGEFSGGLIACQQSLHEYLATNSLNEGAAVVASPGSGDADENRFLTGAYAGWS